MLKAFEHFRDRGAGCDEPCQGHQDRNEREEDNAVGDYCERLHAEEYRGVDADIVATVGKGDACDRPHADLLAGNLGLVIVVTVSAPGLPCGPEAEAQRDETKVWNGCRGQKCSGASGHKDRGDEDARESEVLAGQNAGGGAALACPSREEEGEHDDVVDVGSCEQAYRLQDRGEDHTSSPAA